MLFSNSATLHAPATATNVVDTVGAGDSYMAALIHCLLHADPHELGTSELGWIARRAATAAAITVSRAGADPPWLSELDGRLIAWH
jgi:fructokinase